MLVEFIWGTFSTYSDRLQQAPQLPAADVRSALPNGPVIHVNVAKSA